MSVGCRGSGEVDVVRVFEVLGIAGARFMCTRTRFVGPCVCERCGLYICNL